MNSRISAYFDSTNRVKTLFDRAIELGLTGFALTDHEVLSGSVQMVQTYKEYLEEGKIDENFTIALGNEIYLIDDLEDYQENYTRETHSYYHFLLLAKDERGFMGLKELSSAAWANSFTQRGMDRTPTVKSQLQEIMKRYKGHIVASTACLGGELPQLIFKLQEAEEKNPEEVPRVKEEINDFIKFCIDVFGRDDFYLEVQPNTTFEQIYVNQMIRAIADTHQLDIIFTTDSHYASEDDRIVHKAFLNAMDGEREIDDFYSTTYMMDASEVYSYFADYVPKVEFQEWIDNTNRVASEIEFYDLYQPQEVPKIAVKDYPHRRPTKLESEHKYLVEMLTEGCRQDRYWANVCIERLHEKNLYNETYLNRLNLEAKELLEISEKLDTTMTQYYNTMQKIIEIIWDGGDSFVGPARGSATGFLSCYLLDITQVDPITWNLPYWRHITATRPELPNLYWAV